MINYSRYKLNFKPTWILSFIFVVNGYFNFLPSLLDYFLRTIILYAFIYLLFLEQNVHFSIKLRAERCMRYLNEIFGKNCVIKEEFHILGSIHIEEICDQDTNKFQYTQVVVPSGSKLIRIMKEAKTYPLKEIKSDKLITRNKNKKITPTTSFKKRFDRHINQVKLKMIPLFWCANLSLIASLGFIYPEIMFCGYILYSLVLPIIIYMLVGKHQCYKFSITREECIENFKKIDNKATLLTPKYHRFGQIYLEEIYDDHGRFEYTEVIVPVEGTYQSYIERGSIFSLNNYIKT